ncbi:MULTISPECIES: Gfo/Idh/MocA family protein [Rhizobium/Agrobacterium group]|uniref:Oxidoreductase n=1 Tax=Agrobacterium genomosp. 2 str. CFBP 5494 TaxID=1183436 RepID=A0A9W5B7Y1_9HYPH|nr:MULTISPECIES: Gfo/Idh/MocA family oxidoreductase [Rhizobium/Agrobacterium group]RSC21361.1 gfo/Idh/MocA family oxidoreductase [Agrobacterium sp. FDAARGOS_525]RSC21499.1 gfo/Idh/MocA family oxidoreductase [Agrobacterium sp. FDAARGOS_525]CAD7054609.1 gfo/Idh/MocA family oxidoreductase [Rhizobium sp. P007]CDN95444.1 Oxidoreductase domain-containing protein [Agrobacterium tumefaciens]CUX03188.1 Oxidoreductase [Agrobacterium genomosp. 2 str. CFBP 5494]
MKMAFFGVGHWHAGMHAEAAKAAGAEIVAAWDEVSTHATAFADTYGGRATASVDEAIAAKPELAVVMGRPAEMAEMASRFVSAGIPMLIEKPVGVSGAVLKPIADLAERHGSFVSVALAHRFSPLLAEVSALRQADRLGEVSHSHFRLINGPPQRYVDDGCGWVLDASISGGGALRNLGIHGVNAFVNLSGGQNIDVESVSFGRQLHGTSVEDYALVVLRAADGSIGLVEAGYTFASMTQGIFEWRVSARNASLTDFGGHLQVATLDDGKVRDVAATPVARRYDNVMADTIDRLESGKKPAVTLQDHWRAMDIIDRCYAMAKKEA